MSFGGRGLDAVDHRLSDRVRLAVKADDEAGIHEDPRAIDLVQARGDISASVLGLMGAEECCLIGRFNTDEDGEEPGPTHQGQQLVVVG